MTVLLYHSMDQSSLGRVGIGFGKGLVVEVGWYGIHHQTS